MPGNDDNQSGELAAADDVVSFEWFGKEETAEQNELSVEEIYLERRSKQGQRRREMRRAMNSLMSSTEVLESGLEELSLF